MESAEQVPNPTIVPPTPFLTLASTETPPLNMIVDSEHELNHVNVKEDKENEKENENENEHENENENEKGNEVV